MVIILSFAIAGFLLGLAYVIIKRKINLGVVLNAALLGLLSAGAWKIIKEYKNKNRRQEWR